MAQECLVRDPLEGIVGLSSAGDVCSGQRDSCEYLDQKRKKRAAAEHVLPTGAWRDRVLHDGPEHFGRVRSGVEPFPCSLQKAHNSSNRSWHSQNLHLALTYTNGILRKRARRRSRRDGAIFVIDAAVAW